MKESIEAQAAHLLACALNLELALRNGKMDEVANLAGQCKSSGNAIEFMLREHQLAESQKRRITDRQ